MTSDLMIPAESRIARKLDELRSELNSHPPRVRFGSAGYDHIIEVR